MILSKTKVSNFSLADQLKSGLKTSGSSILSSQEIIELDRGIPFTGMLPLEFVFRVNVLPMEHFFTITGQRDAGKSNMLWTMFRMNALFGGINIYIGSETNENVPKQQKVIGWDAEGNNLMDTVLYHTNVNDLDSVKSILYAASDQIALLDKKFKIPVVVGIDSLGNIRNKGTFHGLDKKKKDAIMKTSEMDAAAKARSLKSFLLEFQSNYLRGRPLTMVVINHLHEKISTTGKGGGQYSPGGNFKEYLNSNELVIRRENKDATYTRDANWVIVVKNKKQQCGAQRNIEVRIPFISTWYENLPDGTEVERCGYDWDEGLVMTLMEGTKTPKDQLKEFLQITPKGQLYNCSTLNLKEVTAKELGKAIHEDIDLCNKLRKMFSVSCYNSLRSPNE